MAGKKGRSGRKPGPVGPYKTVDIEKLRAMSLIGTPIAKIAILLGVSHDTLQNRFLDEINAARTEGEKALLNKAFQLAMSGNTRMLELCLMNRCQWTNRPEVMVNVTQNTLSVPNITEQTKQRLSELHQLIRREALLGTPNDAGDNGDAGDGQ